MEVKNCAVFVVLVNIFGECIRVNSSWPDESPDLMLDRRENKKGPSAGVPAMLSRYADDCLIMVPVTGVYGGHHLYYLSLGKIQTHC